LNYKDTVIVVSNNPFAVRHDKQSVRLSSYENRTVVALQPFQGTFDSRVPVVLNVPSLVKYDIDQQRTFYPWVTANSLNISGNNIAPVALFDSAGNPIAAWTVNQGSPNTVGNAWPVKVTDGTDTADVLGANAPPTITQKPLLVSISPNAQPTWVATYRLNARPYALSNAFAAAGRKQYATIHHATPLNTKTVFIHSVWVALESASAAAIVMAEMRKLSTLPVTGNPAIVPAPYLLVANSESVCLCLPTTPGTEINSPYGQQEWNLGVTGAASVANPPPGLQWTNLLQSMPRQPNWESAPIIRGGIDEGYAITIDVNAAVTVKAYVTIVFSEIA
jgi:hypothetical protein